ncbi:hypothetical protein [Vagococcus fluvialis]|uniref:hypothetical protein n=1 Tax=Vagococcus fluvialis TaxID=2738 RepID=UPI001A8DB637|nr:hypothetical protein [Vagococcus fluvialis]MBO0437453.1 hypothetical protein [Vagococcus fluvialis]
MQVKKLKMILLLSVISLGILGFTTITHAGWDVTGYQNYGNYDFEYTDKSTNGILTNRVNKSTPPLDIKSGIQQLRFLPGAKNYRDYVYISVDNGKTFQPIGEPDKTDKKKGEYIYTTNIVKGAIIKVKNVSFVNGYNLDANILIELNGRVTIKTNPTDSLFNYDVGFYERPPINESMECLALYLSDSRNDKPVAIQEGQYFMLSYRDTYFKGYASGFREPISVYSDNLKYYQINNDRSSLMDKSLMSNDIGYSASNYINHYSGTIEYLRYAYVERLLFFKVGDPLIFYASSQDGMALRTNSLFYNTKSTMIPEPYENATISSKISDDNKYNAEYIIKQTFPRQSNESYYPEDGIEIVPELSNNDDKKIELESVLTDKGNIVDPSGYVVNEETKSIQFPVETLKKLSNETILIKYKTNLDYATNKNIITEFYNREEHTFDIPFKVNTMIKFTNIFENTLEETAKIKYPLQINAKTKKLEVKTGENSGDYSIEDYIDMSTLSLSYPNKNLKLKTEFDHDIKFDKVGSVIVPVTITCDELNFSQVVNVEVTITSEPASYSDKVTLTHEIVDSQVQYRIVQGLPKQYDTAFLPNSLDYEVEIPNSEYLSFMNFTQPSLTIDGETVPATLYSYKKDTHKLSLSKELLTIYEDKELNIVFKTQIDKENKKILNFVKETSSTDSLDLNTSIVFNVISVESPIEKGDTKKYKRETTLNFPLNFTIKSKNLAVLVGQKVGDYLLEDFVDEITATTELNILDNLLSVSLLTTDDTIITQDLNQVKVLMSVDLGSKLTLEKEIAVPIQPILKQPYTVSMGEQFNESDTSNAHFYSYLKIPSQANDIALPEQAIIKLDITKEQTSIIKPRIQKIEGIPVGNYTISDDQTQLVINKTNLKKYSGKTVKISWKTNMNYRVLETIKYFYNKSNHTFNLNDVDTVAVVSYLMSGDEISKSDVSKSYAIAYDFKFRAEALSPSYPSGTSTADNLDIEMFVKNINVDYYETGFKRDFVASFPKKPILFEKIGSTVIVPITIISETLGLTKVIEVPVLVTEELKLGFESVPETLNIVSLTTENGENESNKSLYSLNSTEELIVKDTRKTKSWRLSMIPSELKGVSTDSKTKDKTLAGQFIERKNNKTISLIPLEEYILIKSDKATEIVSDLWNKGTKENGMFYENNTSSNYAGQYRGTITWQLSDVPE